MDTRSDQLLEVQFSEWRWKLLWYTSMALVLYTGISSNDFNICTIVNSRDMVVQTVESCRYHWMGFKSIQPSRAQRIQVRYDFLEI